MKRPKIIDRLALSMGYVPVSTAIDRMEATLRESWELSQYAAEEHGELRKQIEEMNRLDAAKDKLIEVLRHELTSARSERTR